MLASLATGLVKNTITTGVLSIAAAGTDYEVPLTFTGGVSRATNTVSLANIAGLSVIGTATSGGSVAPAAITAGTEQYVLRRSGNALAFGTIGGGAFAGTATNGYVLTSASGVPTWQAASGGGFTPGAAGRIPYGNSGSTALTDDAGFSWASNTLTASASAGGATVSSLVSNTSTAASSHATQIVRVASGAAGDALTQYEVNGVTTWTAGIDNDGLTPEADPYAIKLLGAGAVNALVATPYMVYLGGSGTGLAMAGGHTFQIASGYIAYAGVSLYTPNAAGTRTALALCHRSAGVNDDVRLEFFPAGGSGSLPFGGGGSAALVSRYPSAAGQRLDFYVGNSSGVQTLGFSIFGNGNWKHGAAADSFGGGVGVEFVADATTEPTTAPSGGALRWSFGGKTKLMDATGHITILN